MDPEVAVAIVSTIALAFSFFSLWKAVLAPFDLEVSYDSPTLSIYRIAPEVSRGTKVWWIPSIDIDITFYNLGRKMGKVLDLRFIGTLDSDGVKKRYVFYAKWIVNFHELQRDRADRMGWISSSVQQEWYPLILSGENMRTVHVVLEGLRWDRKLTGTLDLEMQIYSTKHDEWVVLERFQHQLVEPMYEETSSFILPSKLLERSRSGSIVEWDPD